MRKCDYCGTAGHGWEIHPQAVADVAAYARTAEADREMHYEN